MLTINFSINAQPQWRFHVALEDATGAKDTIWLIWDTTAHIGQPVDVTLGEGSLHFDSSVFNVYVFNDDADSTKTVALPYSLFPSISTYIYAFNFQLPITISWDTSLFRAPYLPVGPNNYINEAILSNDYFFFINNDPLLQAFNMLIDTMALAPAFNWFSQSHFPLAFGTDYVNTGINDSNKEQYNNVFPTVVSDILNIKSSGFIESVQITNVNGIVVYEKKLHQVNNSENLRILLTELSYGLYIIKITDKSKKYSYEKFFKF
jgi:hypothetical protein